MRPPETVAFSSTIQLEKRITPRAHPNMPTPNRVNTPQQQPQHQSPAKAATPRHELSIRQPNASPQPREQTSPNPSSLAQRISRDEHALARESTRLKAANDPLANVRKAQAPATIKRTMFDASGQARENFEAYLFPLQHWFDGSLSCYYVQYNAQFSSGGSERGTIPWPVCYPKTHDAMAIADAISERTGQNVPLPIPVPQTTYILPKGTYLTPLLKNIYAHKP